MIFFIKTLLLVLLAVGIVQARSKQQAKSVRGKFLSLSSSVVMIFISFFGLLAGDLESDEAREAKHFHAYWYSIGKSMQSQELQGDILLVTDMPPQHQQISFEEKAKSGQNPIVTKGEESDKLPLFLKIRESLHKGCGASLQLSEFITPYEKQPESTDPNAFIPLHEEFTIEKLGQIIQENSACSAIIFNCRLPWNDEQFSVSDLLHSLEEDGCVLPKLIILSKSPLPKEARKLLRENKVVLICEAISSSKSKILRLPESLRGIADLRHRFSE